MILVFFIFVGMRLRNMISILLLTVYTLVLAHSIIPHHHHSRHTPHAPDCSYEKQQKQSCCEHIQVTEHQESDSDNCDREHHRHHHSHTICSFEDNLVLTKAFNLSVLFIPSNSIALNPVNNRVLHKAICLTLKIPEKRCRDVQLRGPPLFL